MIQRPDPRDVRRAASIFKVLSHPARVHIACMLANGRSATQTELLQELHWPQSTMSRHLTTMRERGLIKARRDKNEVHLELASDVAERLLQVVCDWVHPETGEQFAGHFADLVTAKEPS